MGIETQDGFYKKIYQLIGEIPAGSVATYGQLAKLAGKPRGARQVGYAVSHVPDGLKLPFHRVMASSGKLAPDHVFEDQSFQRMLLEMEGVSFLPSGKIDMKHCLWQGPN